MFSGQDWSPSRLMEDLGIHYVNFGKEEFVGRFEVDVCFIDVKVC